MQLKPGIIGWLKGHLLLVSCAFTGLAMISCENEEGIGGTGSISGKLTEEFYAEDFSRKIHEEAAADEEIFIMFGDKQGIGDKVNTDLNGAFSFRYLYPGTYHLYYRSDDSTMVPDDGWSELISVDLASGEDLDLGQLVKLNTLDFDEGEARISGTVEKIKYSKDSFWPNLVVEYVDFAHEYEVYLRYGSGPGYDERVRTALDGTFVFRDLIPGNYTVFLYSEDVSKVTEHVVLEFVVDIVEFDQETDLGVITVEER